jgi:hypothetical protein
MDAGGSTTGGYLRIGGWLLVAGGIISIISCILVFLIPGPFGLYQQGPNSVAANVTAIIGGILLISGLPALLKAQGSRARRLGMAGVILLILGFVFGLVILSAVQVLDLTIPGSIPHPGGEGPPPLAVIPAVLSANLILLGGIVLTVSMRRAKVFRPAIYWLLLVTSVLFAPLNAFVPGVFLNGLVSFADLALLFVALTWAGAELSRSAASAPIPTAAS